MSVVGFRSLSFRERVGVRESEVRRRRRVRSNRHRASQLAFHERFHLLHEQCHRGQELIEVVTPVKIDLEGF